MTKNIREIKTCEVCGNENLKEVMDLGLHPMCDDLRAIGDNTDTEVYPIKILLCDDCLTAHQAFQIQKETLFKPNYHYRSRFTKDVLDGMQDLVDDYYQNVDNDDEINVLDIGCNDGSLLNFFKLKGANTIGIEPSDAFMEARNNGHEVYNEFISVELCKNILKKHKKIDYITFTNVFAHIEDLHSLLRAVSILINDNTKLIIENHYMGAILEKNQFDTFYHEHPRTYSLHSFKKIAQTLDMTISNVSFTKRYGGNIRVCLQRNRLPQISKKELDEILLREQEFDKAFSRMVENKNIWLKNKKKILNELVKKHGKLSAKAFPGRAAILVRLLELDENQIEAVYEKEGSNKIGYYLPGTKIPIKSDEKLMSQNIEIILNFAWHISNEIKHYLKNSGYSGTVVDILEQKDFKLAEYV